MKKDQKQTNVQKQIDALERHASVANEEMGIIKQDIAQIKVHVQWVRDIYDSWEKKVAKMDDRIWMILATIVIGFLATITLNILK